MQPVMIPQVVDQLHRLLADQLASVFDFGSHLAEQDADANASGVLESVQTMLVSGAVLSRDWGRPEEDAAWQNL